MISRKSHRTTIEDKTSEIPAIYNEHVVAEWRLFGIKLMSIDDTYECHEKECKHSNNKSIGFKSKQ